MARLGLALIRSPLQSHAFSLIHSPTGTRILETHTVVTQRMQAHRLHTLTGCTNDTHTGRVDAFGAHGLWTNTLSVHAHTGHRPPKCTTDHVAQRTHTQRTHVAACMATCTHWPQTHGHTKKAHSLPMCSPRTLALHSLPHTY